MTRNTGFLHYSKLVVATIGFVPVLVVGLLGMHPEISAAAEPFPVETFPFPFRSVAADGDFSSLRYNPAALGMRSEVEFAFHHKYSGSPTGFNASTLRAKSLGFSISWLDDAQFGKRREYLVSGGHRISKLLLLGTTFRWLKADDPRLQNLTTWTFAAAITPAPAWTMAARWENALHTKVNGAASGGLWVFGVRSSPMGNRAEFMLDWIYPDFASPADTDLRFSMKILPTPGIALYGFVDTQERVGLELEFSVERSKGGSEIRLRDFSEYQDGTAYVAVLNQEYPNARRREKN